MAACATLVTGTVLGRSVSPQYLTVSGASPSTCTGYIVFSPAEWAEYLTLKSEVQTLQNLFNSGAIDFSLVSLMFGGGLLLWAVGCGVGLLVNLLRKMRLP